MHKRRPGSVLAPLAQARMSALHGSVPCRPCTRGKCYQPCCHQTAMLHQERRSAESAVSAHVQRMPVPECESSAERTPAQFAAHCCSAHPERRQHTRVAVQRVNGDHNRTKVCAAHLSALFCRATRVAISHCGGGGKRGGHLARVVGRRVCAARRHRARPRGGPAIDLLRVVVVAKVVP